mmetsp:Transcript_40777/g.82196  ORF Transcript_40777/g.82196 Transcript_40777/m.82196 type:complete len:201 (-) Transcript_40777:372-974(-)
MQTPSWAVSHLAALSCTGRMVSQADGTSASHLLAMILWILRFTTLAARMGHRSMAESFLTGNATDCKQETSLVLDESKAPVCSSNLPSFRRWPSFRRPHCGLTTGSGRGTQSVPSSCSKACGQGGSSMTPCSPATGSSLRSTVLCLRRWRSLAIPILRWRRCWSTSTQASPRLNMIRLSCWRWQISTSFPRWLKIAQPPS